MSNSIFENIELNRNDFLVERLSDYYSKKEGLDTNIGKNDLHFAGVILAVGEKININNVGKIIYYHKNIATEVNVKGIGIYELVPFHLKLMIRMDQTRKNY